MAARAAGSDASVIEIRSEPAHRRVAVAALERGHEVPLGLSGELHAVVADDAKTRDRERNLRMIDRFGGFQDITV